MSAEVSVAFFGDCEVCFFFCGHCAGPSSWSLRLSRDDSDEIRKWNHFTVSGLLRDTGTPALLQITSDKFDWPQSKPLTLRSPFLERISLPKSGVAKLLLLATSKHFFMYLLTTWLQLNALTLQCWYSKHTSVYSFRRHGAILTFIWSRVYNHRHLLLL